MALTYQSAVEQTITAGEQIHQIVNGTATTEVTVEDGSKVPSIRKALLDNFYFKDPIAWQVGQTENVFNQLRQFTDGSWWYAPSATASNPISMGVTPVGDPLWKIYSFDAIGKLEPRADEALRRSYADAGYNLVNGSFEAGGTLVNSNDVLLQESTGKAFSGPAGSVVPGTNPASGGFIDRSAWPVFSMQEFNAGAYGLHPSNTGLQNCQALQALSAAVNSAVNARVVFPAGTYTLGAQTFAGATGKGYSYKAEDALYIHDIDNLELHFDGCKFVMAPDLKFGSFDPVTGAVYNPPSMPFLNMDYRAETGRFFRIQDNKSVRITGVMEFDANDGTRVVGGKWGDKDWQVWEIGLYAIRNTCFVSDANIYLHKFLEDCAYFSGAAGDSAFMEVSNLIATKSGRNVVTFAGGDNCSFNHCIIGLQGQGDSAISSLPASAVDVETEIISATNLSFNHCKFLTSSNGVYGEVGTMYGVQFNNCDFHADRAGDVSLYWKFAGTDFNDCNFYGPVLTVGPGVGTGQKLTNTKMTRCYFTNISKDGSILTARSPGKGVLIDSANPATVNGVVYRTEFHDCLFNALIDGVSATMTLWAAEAIVKNCKLIVSGTLPETMSSMIANLNGAIVDGFNVENRLVREVMSSSSTCFVSVNSPTAPLPGPRNCTMNFKYNSNNQLTMVWGGAVQGASNSWAGRYVSATRARYNEIPAAEAIPLRRDIFASSVDRGVGPMYLLALNSIPTSGDYAKGDTIINANASAGQASGWKCTTAGTAGSTAVFKTISTLEA